MNVTDKRKLTVAKKVATGIFLSIGILLLVVACLGLYITVGYALTLPYQYFAGGLTVDVTSSYILIFGPTLLLAFLIVILFQYDKLQRVYKPQKIGWYRIPLLWITLMWVSLPIVMYQFSLLAKNMGATSAAHFLEENRYVSMRFAIAIALLLYVLKRLLEMFFEETKKKRL